MKLNKLLSIFLASVILVASLPVKNAKAGVQIPIAKLNANKVFQEIDGFGVSQSADVYGKQIYEHNKRDKLMDLLFSNEKGIGLSILRSEVGSGLNMPTIHPDKDTWDFKPYEPEQWVMNEARKRGVQTFMSTVWSPPAWMKTNNRIVRGGRLKEEYYPEYAKYLAEYVKGYKKHHNVKIDAISIANEPEYAAFWQSNLWSKEEFRKFVKEYLKPTFVKEKVDAKIIVGEEGTWTDKRLSAIYEDKDAIDSVDIIASHYYRGRPYVFEGAKKNNKKIWLTETSETIFRGTGFKDGVTWSRYIHNFLTNADINAFIFWLGAAYKNNNESLIRLTDKDNYIDAKRLYSFGNFSKFIKPGYKRIEITENPTGNLHLSAYKNDKTGDFVVVALNDGQNNETIDLTFEGVKLNKLTPHITNDKYNLEKFPSLYVNDNIARISVSGYTTITYTGNVNDEKHQENSYRIYDNLDNWDKIYSKSNNWMLEAYNPYNAFDNDFSRARRTRLSRENIVYKLENMKDFDAVIYYHIALQGLDFEISSDGQNWEKLDYIYDLPMLTGGYWEKINVRPKKELKEGTNYLRITFDKGGKCWDKHLSSIKIR